MRYRFMRFPEGKTKAVTLSYDDGPIFDLPMLDILDRYGIKCTFNLNSIRMTEGRADTVPIEEVKSRMLEKGHEIAVHGEFHRAPGNIRPIETVRDVLNCRLWLEQTFGMIIRGMAYPDTGITHVELGTTYETIRSCLKDLDIAYSRTLGCDNDTFSMPSDWYAWLPTIHHDNPKAIEYAEKFVAYDYNGYAATRWPRLFYIWGHSYEFDRNNNWDRLETLCQILSGKDDIWYATNIEICDYANAYESLRYSADGTVVYNPTLYTIWFDVDGTLYSIKPGETITVA